MNSIKLQRVFFEDIKENVLVSHVQPFVTPKTVAC